VTKRIVAAALGLVVAMLAILGVPFLRTVERYERERLRLDLVHDAVVMGANVEDQLSEDTAANAFTTSAVHAYALRTGARIVIVNRDGLVWTDSGGAAPFNAADRRTMKNRPEFIEALAGKFSAQSRFSKTLGYTALYVAVPVSSAGQILGAVRVSFPISDVNHKIAVQRTKLLTFGLAIAVLVSLLSVWLARWVTRPISALQTTTRQFGEGNLSARAKTDDGPNDVRRLAHEFNEMAERLDALVESQNAFVADASHELRSPLTAIRLQLEAMEYGSLDTINNRRGRALEEVNRLSRNVDGLLLLASQSAQKRPVVNTIVDLHAVLMDRASFWETLTKENGIQLAVRASGGLRVRVAPDRVATVLDNLIANAIDAAPPGSTITLSGHAGGNNVELHVVDEGAGMTPDQRVAAFDRFWRASSHRTALGGSGLGLAIARKLAAVDHGILRLDAASPHGLDAVVSYGKVDS
jgi:signal transduction histidine kinase